MESAKDMSILCAAESRRIRAAWQGRVSGCVLGKSLEVLSFQEGRSGVLAYLEEAEALPLRDYVPLLPDTVVARTGRQACAGEFARAEPDDDINYTVLALLLLEKFGTKLSTEDIARTWLSLLPAGNTWTAERSAYATLLARMDAEFVNGAPPGFDLAECSDNEFNEWIGAQIRADLYGWVCPGRPDMAAHLAATDAALSHRESGIESAIFIAALAAAIPESTRLDDAIHTALRFVAPDGAVANAVLFALDLDANDASLDRLHAEYKDLSPVHTLNNLALVMWALVNHQSDFSTAIGAVVMAGLDTDCNAATVGGLLGLAGARIPEHWTGPWNGRIAVSLAGMDELQLDDLVARTVRVSQDLAMGASA